MLFLLIGPMAEINTRLAGSRFCRDMADVRRKLLGPDRSLWLVSERADLRDVWAMHHQLRLLGATLTVAVPTEGAQLEALKLDEVGNG
jgi:hypothetical protein